MQDLFNDLKYFEMSENTDCDPEKVVAKDASNTSESIIAGAGTLHSTVEGREEAQIETSKFSSWLPEASWAAAWVNTAKEKVSNMSKF